MFFQYWFERSDLTAEEVLHDTRAIRQYVAIGLGQEPVPNNDQMQI